jgi:hypothetical protein
MMVTFRKRSSLVLYLFGGALLFAAPAAATTFTVHGWELGEKVDLIDGRQVWTALLDVDIDGQAGASFCVDLDTHISMSAYNVRALLDPFTGSSPADEAPRDFVWAGHVMESFGDVDALVSASLTRKQAITAVQAAIWEGIYGASVIDVSTLSLGALSMFDTIMASSPGAPRGASVVVELVGKQDQIATRPIPEPSAAVAFGLGTLLVARARRHRSRR